MNFNNLETKYTFDDVLLIPQHSEIKSRKFPLVSISKGGLNLGVPIIASPMNSVTGEDMIIAMAQQGGASVLHRFMPLKEQILIAGKAYDALIKKNIYNPHNHIYVAVGATDDYMDRVRSLWASGVSRFCIDVANGHSKVCIDAVKRIRDCYPLAKIMAGNVCTAVGAEKLIMAGANSIRCGIGPGAVCKTREVTGHGYPQLSAIAETCLARGNHNVAIIADGGIRHSGDAVKALAAGADAIMVGSMLSGTVESPGEIIEENNRLYKYYSGMASERGRSQWFDREKTGFVPEGVSIKIPYTGKTVENVINNLVGGLKTGMSYSGASSLDELRAKAQWVRVTNAGVIEGSPHGKILEK